MGTIAFRSALRRRLSVWLIFALLFTQLGTAAYACPLFQSLNEPSTLTECHEGKVAPATMDPEQPLLCQLSCDADAQTLANFSAIDFSSGVALLYRVATLSPQQLSASAPPLERIIRAETPPGWPPLYLFHRTLRN